MGLSIATTLATLSSVFESFYANPVDNFCSGHKQTDFLQFYLSPNLKFNMVMMNLTLAKTFLLKKINYHGRDESYTSQSLEHFSFSFPEVLRGKH